MVCQQHFDKNFTVPHWDTERLDELGAVREDNVIRGVSVPVRELGRVILRQHHYRHRRRTRWRVSVAFRCHRWTYHARLLFKESISLREVFGYPESVADMKVPGDVQDERV